MSGTQALPELEGEAIAAQALDGRIGRVGAYLAVGADVFFFAAWFFAYFYLRALNNNHAWLADGVSRPRPVLGAAIAVLAVASAVAYLGALRAASVSLFRILAGASFLLGVGAVSTAFYLFWHLDFGITDGGYPSVFTGLLGSWVVQFSVALAWLATILAQARVGGDTMNRRVATATFGYFLYFLAAIQVIAYLLLYLL